MAIQTNIKEAAFDSAAADAELEYICLEIYDDDEEDDDRRVFKLDFASDEIKLGRIPKDFLSTISGKLFEFDGLIKNQLTLPSLRYCIHYKDANGNTTKVVEYY